MRAQIPRSHGQNHTNATYPNTPGNDALAGSQYNDGYGGDGYGGDGDDDDDEDDPYEDEGDAFWEELLAGDGIDDEMREAAKAEREARKRAKEKRKQREKERKEKKRRAAAAAASATEAKAAAAAAVTAADGSGDGLSQQVARKGDDGETINVFTVASGVCAPPALPRLRRRCVLGCCCKLLQLLGLSFSVTVQKNRANIVRRGRGRGARSRTPRARAPCGRPGP